MARRSHPLRAARRHPARRLTDRASPLRTPPAPTPRRTARPRTHPRQRKSTPLSRIRHHSTSQRAVIPGLVLLAQPTRRSQSPDSARPPGQPPDWRPARDAVGANAPDLGSAGRACDPIARLPPERGTSRCRPIPTNGNSPHVYRPTTCCRDEHQSSRATPETPNAIFPDHEHGWMSQSLSSPCSR